MSCRRSPQSCPSNQDRVGLSDFQSLSDESLKSRFSAMSTRYKESISKSTRGWKERLFSRNNPTVDHGSESRNAVSADIAAVSRLMEHLETTETSRTPLFPEPNRVEENLPPDRTEQLISGIDNNLPLAEGNRQAPCATTSAFN
nr:E3 ubiquitin-protein ligase RHF2A-like isoform X1 [Ipomoea batatas]